MEEIKITETETLMSDGSTHVHCETEHEGKRIVAGYNISAQCVDKVAFRRDATPAMIRAAIDALRIENVTVSFNPRTCDPTGEGEELAKAITDAVADKDSGAIGALLQAAVCLGSEILDMDDDPETLATKIFENDHWRERLNNAITTAEMWIAEIENEHNNGLALIGVPPATLAAVRQANKDRIDRALDEFAVRTANIGAGADAPMERALTGEPTLEERAAKYGQPTIQYAPGAIAYMDGIDSGKPTE